MVIHPLMRILSYGYVTPYVQMDCSEHPLYMAGFHTFWFNHDWLVVSIPLKKMLVSWDDYSIPKCFWKVIQTSMVPVTTNQNNIINHYPWLLSMINHH